MLIQIPHAFFAAEAKRLGFTLPEPGDYGVGFLFMPREPAIRNEIERIWWETAREEGLKVLGWRDVPVDGDVLGAHGEEDRAVLAPGVHRPRADDPDEAHFERKLYICRKVVSNRVKEVLGLRRGPIIPSRPRPAPSSTRAWCWPTRWSAISATSTTSA
jgi:glutamate synthase (NADPH) large chain